MGGDLFDQLLLDAGYDSEANHELLRKRMKTGLIMPPRTGRPTTKPPTGKWRWLMAAQFPAAGRSKRHFKSRLPNAPRRRSTAAGG